MFLLIDKPKGITSHDVVDYVRKVTGEKRVGHAGTLDPNATGLLIVGVGRDSTKRLSGLVAKDKTYVAEIFLGEVRDTDDIEGEVIRKNIDLLPEPSKVKEVLKSFIGNKEQAPPPYSAVKVKGKKAYEMARKGKEVFLKPRKVTFYSVKLLSYKYPDLKVEAKVSSGTYIRSLARDVGERLGTGAFLKDLRRTRVGNYKVEDAIELKNLKKEIWQSKAFEID